MKSLELLKINKAIDSYYEDTSRPPAEVYAGLDELRNKLDILIGGIVNAAVFSDPDPRIENPI